MNYAKAINTTTQKKNTVSGRLPTGWSVFNNVERNIKKSVATTKNENDEPYYLNPYESYCFECAIEDIYNRRLAESMKYYQETSEFDIFAQEAQRNAVYLAKYPDVSEEDYDYEYYEDE